MLIGTQCSWLRWRYSLLAKKWRQRLRIWCDWTG